jgi:hypothetical protein
VNHREISLYLTEQEKKFEQELVALQKRIEQLKHSRLVFFRQSRCQAADEEWHKLQEKIVAYSEAQEALGLGDIHPALELLQEELKAEENDPPCSASTDYGTQDALDKLWIKNRTRLAAMIKQLKPT